MLDVSATEPSPFDAHATPRVVLLTAAGSGIDAGAARLFAERAMAAIRETPDRPA